MVLENPRPRPGTKEYWEELFRKSPPPEQYTDLPAARNATPKSPELVMESPIMFGRALPHKRNAHVQAIRNATPKSPAPVTEAPARDVSPTGFGTGPTPPPDSPSKQRM